MKKNPQRSRLPDTGWCSPPGLLRRSVIYTAMALTALPPAALAAPLNLSTAPAGTAFKLPAPNVIISVDDSGSMGTTGMQTLRDALHDTFSATNVPDGSIRLGWQAMSGCYTIPSGGNCNNQNAVRVLDSTHRSHFTAWVNTLAVQGGTPSHRMLFNAGEYLRTPPSANSPWASVPGTTQEPMLTCRKSYNLFMTDGGWNTTSGWNASNPGNAALIGNADGTNRTLGDGTTTYDVSSPQTRIYRDAFGSTGLPTFADLAFHYWATDLQPSMPNTATPRIKIEGTETFGTGSGAFTLNEYWNPRNDPATWQHMTMYTVGFLNAANWNGTGATPLFGANTWSGASYNGLMLGTTNWTDPITGNETTRMPELWHAALNGRGKFIPAPTAASLAPAFKDILNDIATDNSHPVTSMAGSAKTTRAASMGYSASYKGADWSGAIEAFKIAAGGVPATTISWNTATLMDAATFLPASRTVLSQKTVAGTRTGIEWTWANLSADQQTLMNTVGLTVDTLGEDRVNFLRGDRSKEGSGQPFRVRGSRHGDIVNSKLWFTPGKPASGYAKDNYAAFRTNQATRTPMIYVGANAGMLHGFDATSGAERVAYVPEGLHAKLPALTDKDYQHKYYVDGSPFTADLFHTADGSGTGSSGAWKTYLAGFTGAGSKGYFVLDVTNPTGFSASSVILDTTASADADIGHIVGEPTTDPTNTSNAQQITQLNNGRWALVMGNGYNSTDEKAVLLIQYLDGARELLKITADAAVGGGNGLSTPRLLDLNGDRKADVVYAGDLKGNLWKFDLSKTTAANWGVALGGYPLFTATTGVSGSPRQPITSAPVWQAHPNGGVVVVFGTGRNVTDADRTDVATQSVYGIHDKSVATFGTGGAITSISNGGVVSGRSLLQQQTFSAASTAETSTGQSLWTLSSNAVSDTQRGWYVDLTKFSGERVLDNPSWYQGNLIDVKTVIPARASNLLEESCEPASSGEQGYMLTVDATSGNAPKSQVYGYSATGAPTPGGTGSPSYTSAGERIVLRDPAGKEVCVAPPGQAPGTCKEGLGTVQLRASWRQLR